MMARTEDRLFADWHRRRDPTHVAFHREETRDIAPRLGWTCEIPREGVAILRKPGGLA